jgi:hypothetical protein
MSAGVPSFDTVNTHQETREERPDLGEHLDDRVASSELMWLVIARTDVHDRREVARFEQAHAACQSSFASPVLDLLTRIAGHTVCERS